MPPTITDADIERISEKALPPRARMLVRAIGLPATLALLDRHGGTPIRIPVRARRSRKLSTILTATQIDRLAELWGGQSLELPKIDSCLIQVRDQEIARRSDAGDTHVALAREFKLTRRQIINIVNKARETTVSPQATLFE